MASFLLAEKKGASIRWPCRMASFLLAEKKGASIWWPYRVALFLLSSNLMLWTWPLATK